MATSETKWSFSLDDQVSEPSEAMAESLESLRARMEKSEGAIRQYGQSLRSLRGSSDEVRAAKEALKARINAERDALSRANLQVLKAGTSYAALAERAKKARLEAGRLSGAKAAAFGRAVDAAGGPVASLRGRVASLKDMVEGAGGSMGVAQLAAVGLTAAVVALAAAVVVGAAALAKWVVGAASAARSANLVREAATGSAQSARSLGAQVDALAARVPTAKGALNDLAVSLAKGGLSGQALVDTLNAVGQASAALGDDAGGKLRELVERGRLSGAMAVSPADLRGTGLQFDDVAGQLARSMRVSVKDARAALAEGRVKLGDGAAALRAAVEQRFGKVNLAKMLDLSVMAGKLRERLESLTDGVNLEPMLRGLESLAELFSETSVSGAALKQLVTVFGDTVSSTLGALAPFAAQFFKGMVLAALDLAISFFKVRNALRSWLGDSRLLKDFDGVRFSLEAGKYAVGALAAGFVVLGAVVALAVAPFAAFGAAMVWLQQKGTDLGLWLKGLDWSDMGRSLVDGLVGGIKSGWSRVTASVTDLADQAKGAFKRALGIASPSKVFAEFGENTTAGFEQGVEQGSPGARRALTDLTDVPGPAGGGQARAGGAGPVQLSVSITVNGGSGSPQEIAKAIEEGAVAKIVRALEQASLGAGVPVT